MFFGGQGGGAGAGEGELSSCIGIILIILLLTFDILSGSLGTFIEHMMTRVNVPLLVGLTGVLL